MARFDADITDPPAVDTNDPSGTIMDWAGYALVVGMAFAFIAVGQSTVQPTVTGLLNSVPFIDVGDSESAGVRVG